MKRGIQCGPGPTVFIYLPNRKTAACSAGSTMKMPDKPHRIKTANKTIIAKKPPPELESELEAGSDVLCLSEAAEKKLFNLSCKRFNASSRSGGWFLPPHGSLPLSGPFHPMSYAPRFALKNRILWGMSSLSKCDAVKKVHWSFLSNKN